MNNLQSKWLFVLIFIFFVVIMGEISFYFGIRSASTPKPVIEPTNIKKAADIVDQIYKLSPSSAVMTVSYGGILTDTLPYTDRSARKGIELVITPKNGNNRPITLFFTYEDMQIITIKNSKGKAININSLKVGQEVEIDVLYDFIQEKDISIHLVIKKDA